MFADRSVVRSTRLRVIKGRRGYGSEREEKCARVAGQRGSRVDALTRLEEDTEKENMQLTKQERLIQYAQFLTTEGSCYTLI